MVIPCPKIEQLVLDWFKRIEAGEMIAAAENLLTREHAFLALGSGDNEWYRGREELINAYGEAANLGKPEIKVIQIKAFQEGSVGWVSDTVMLKRPGVSEVSLRHTFVLHQEQGDWKVVHAHYSCPVTTEG